MAHNHFNTTHVWPVYIGPASYYASRVDVGIHRDAARVPKGLLQHRRLLSGGQEFDLDDQFHWFKYGHSFETCNKKGKALPPPEGRGFRAAER